MLAILEDHLKQIVTVESYADFHRAHDLFDDFGWEHAQTAFEDLLLSNHADVSGQELYNLTLTICKSILTEHQMTLTEEATLDNYCTILEYIKQIEKTEFITESVNALSSEEVLPLELFCNHVAMVMGGDGLEYMEFVQYISPTVIAATLAYFRKREEFEIAVEAMPEGNKEIYVEMDAFSRIVSGNTMKSYTYLMTEGGIIGMPMEFYWKIHQEYMLSLPMDDLVYELIGFGMMAEGGMDNVIKTAMDFVSTKFENIDLIEKIRNQITTTLVEYRNEVTNGVRRTSN